MILKDYENFFADLARSGVRLTASSMPAPTISADAAVRSASRGF